ncbi:virulence factor TspB C-terminal domain-related protein [Caballeronia sp. KNU42]
MKKHRVFRQLVMVVSLASLLLQQQRVAEAQAAPILQEAFSGTINEAIAAAVESNLARRGITVAANDATMAATEQYIGAAANAASYASTALTAVATVAGAPVWLTVALGVGALAAVGGVAWGIYQLTQNNGTGTTTDGQPMPMSLTLTPSTTSGTSTAPSADPAGAYQLYNTGTCNTFTTATCPTGLPTVVPSDLRYEAAATGAYTIVAGVSGMDIAQQLGSWMMATTCPAGGTNMSCTVSYQDQGITQPIGAPATEWYIVRLDYTPFTLDQNGNQVLGTPTFVTAGGNGIVPNYGYVAPPGPVSGSLSNLQSSITSSMLSQPVSQPLLADMANQLWRDAAAQPGYNGEPYSPANPITAQDIATAPVSPTWNDLLTAPAPIGTTVIPISPTASTSVSTSTGTTPASGTTTTSDVNPCLEDPTASACQPLGSAPTPPPIPASSVTVTMSPWDIGPSSGSCPAPLTVSAFGAPLTFDYSAICTFAERVQPLILALCALGAALIVVMGLKS